MKRKILSLALTLVMMVTLLPMAALPAVALPETGLAQYLLTGINVLTADELSTESLSPGRILRHGANLAGHFRTTGTARTYVESSAGRTVADMIWKNERDLSVSVSASAGIGRLFSSNVSPESVTTF